MFFPLFYHLLLVFSEKVIQNEKVNPANKQDIKYNLL